ncbi:MAG: tandem-95 repeat protein [Verrucomicrobiales bacterium]|nr:tandem-95 repeat protein [Verrucomicrobiales bacterium]
MPVRVKNTRAGMWILRLLWWGLLSLGMAHPMPSMAAAPRVWVQFLDDSAVDGMDEPSTSWAVADEVLIRLRPGVVPQGRALFAGGNAEWRWLVPRRNRGLAAVAGATAWERMGVLRLPKGTDLATALAAIRKRPEVDYAEPNLRLTVVVEPATGFTGPPNDFEFVRQWGLHNTGQTGGSPGSDIAALEAWSVTTGSDDVVVAIVDTGVDTFHPDLERNIWVNARETPGNGVDDDGNGFIDDVHGYDFVSDDADPTDDNVHGTHVAGILGAAGNDENGIVGVAWRVRMMALKAFDEAGAGTLDDTISAIAYAVSAGAKVINASWGTTTRSRALDEAVAEAVSKGVVFVAAAGNNGTEVPFYPAAVASAIAVGATDAKDRSSTFSNHGLFVDLVAPGDAIQSTLPNGTWGLLSGTSMAAPHVSGLVALLLSLQPALTPPEVASILRSTAEDIDAGRFAGAGRIHAGRAVRIQQPLPDAEIQVAPVISGILDLRGTAGGRDFAGYRLEFGSGKRPSQWTEVVSGAVPVKDGLLKSGYDSTRVDDGVYVLRLTVSNGVGQSAMVRQEVTIRNVLVEQPLNNDIRRAGDVIEIRGTVAGEGRTFEVSWGLGRSPNQWLTNGVQLTGGGRAAVVNGLLATWDSAVAPANEFVTLRLIARNGDRLVGEAFGRMIHLENRLRDGWPVTLPFSEDFPVAFWREFVVADLEGDGRKEIVLVDHGEPGGRNPRVVVLEPNGTVRWTHPLPVGAPEYDAPVVGDLDGDGKSEILVDTGAAGEITALTWEGQPLGGGWPATPGGTHFGKLLADLDGDGRTELVALSNPPADLVGNRIRRLLVISAEGQVLRQWTLGACDAEANVPEQLPAVANLDSDSDLEIVAVDGCLGLSAFDLGETNAPLWTSYLGANLFGSPVAGDLDGDGREEILIGGASRGQGQPGGVFLVERDGKIRPGWPVATAESFHSSAALADLDGDGGLEIVIPSWDSTSIHVLRGDGFEATGWPVVVNGVTRSMPVIGDVDGDAYPDVVLPTPGLWLTVVLNGDVARAGGIRAWRLDGRPIDFHPHTPADGLVMESAGGSGGLRLAAPVLTDLDGNGRLDVVASTVQDGKHNTTAPLSTYKQRSSLYAWELPVPWNETSAPWPAFQSGPSRTGRYYRPPPPNQAPRLRGIPSQTIAVGADFRTLNLDRYVEDPDGRVDELTWTVRGAVELIVEVDAARRLVITQPSGAWAGRERIELGVRDRAGAEDRAVVLLAAVPGYQPPIATADRVESLEDTPVDVFPLLNDGSPQGKPLRLLGVSRPASGVTEMIADAGVRYTPKEDFYGEDSFEYTLADDDGGLSIGEVRVRVAGVDDNPRPEPDRLILDEDTTGEIEPLANDVEVDGEPLSLVEMGHPDNAEVVALGGDRFRVVPATNYSGVISIPYWVRDSGGAVATGQVAVLVKPVNDPPSLQDQEVRMNRNRATDVFYDAVDADGDKLSFTVIEGPTNGVLLAYPSLANYEPTRGYVGDDRFTYTASDGVTTVGPATVNLVVEERNNEPQVDPVATVTAVDQPLEIPVLVRDADGDATTIRVDRPPENGEAVLVGTNILYTPEPGFAGTNRFTLRASDAVGEGPEAVFEVRVTRENTPPRAQSEVLTVARNAATPIRLRATDGENNPLSYRLVTLPAYGALDGNAPSLSYTPRQNFRGLDRLEFEVMDGKATSELAVVHLLVRDPNSLPVVTNQFVLTRRDQALAFDLEARDADGHALRMALLKGPQAGRVYGLGTRFTYVPRAGFEGRDSFTYKVWDGFSYSLTASVTIVVEREEAVPPTIVEARPGPFGFAVEVRTELGRQVRLDYSEDLITWTSLGTIASTSGTARWLDAAYEGRKQRFYRAAVIGITAIP